MPDAHIGLDVWHFVMRYALSFQLLFGLMLTVPFRYLEEITGRTKNPYYLTIAREIGDAIYAERATAETYPRYHNRYEQETRLDAVFRKYAAIPDIWGAGAQKVRKLHLLLHLQADPRSISFVRRMPRSSRTSERAVSRDRGRTSQLMEAASKARTST